MTQAALKRAGRKPSRPDYISASQIGKFLDCERMWGFRYIEGRQEPETASQKLGKLVHKELELWFTKKRPPDLNTHHGEIAKVGLKHYPPPHKHMKAEEEIWFEFDGITYMGFIDLLYAIDENTISVNDHKSTVDFKWMKTEEMLRTDPQAILYSAWATLAFDIEWVELQWTYFRTSPPYKSDVTTLRWHRDEIWQAMDRIHQVAKRIVTSRSKKVLDLEPDLSACGKYRGCPHREICVGQMTATERMRASFRASERAKLAAKLKHEPPTSASRHLNILQKPPQRTKDNDMGLMANLRNKKVEASEEAPKTKTTTAARPLLLGKGKTETKTEGRRQLPLPALNGKKAPEVSEDHEAPEQEEPPVEQPNQPTRRRGPNKPKEQEINPLLILAEFHKAGIAAGADIDTVQQHYNAWVEAAG